MSQDLKISTKRCQALYCLDKEPGKFSRCAHTILPNSPYCQQHQQAYIQSYTTYKQLSAEISSYEVMKPGAKLDLKILDTREGCTKTLQLLVPKLQQVVDLREHHRFIYYSHTDNEVPEDEDGHVKIIKAYTAIFNLLTPIYNKWRRIIQTERQALADTKTAPTVESKPEFPYYIPTIEQRREMDRLRKERNIVKQSEREKFQRPKFNSTDTKIPIDQQHIPEEYYTPMRAPVTIDEPDYYEYENLVVAQEKLEYASKLGKGTIELNAAVLSLLRKFITKLNEFRSEHLALSSYMRLYILEYVIRNGYSKYLQLNVRLIPCKIPKSGFKHSEKSKTKYLRKLSLALESIIKDLIIVTDHLDTSGFTLVQDRSAALHKLMAVTLMRAGMSTYFDCNLEQSRKITLPKVNIKLEDNLVIEFPQNAHTLLMHVDIAVTMFVTYFNDILNWVMAQEGDNTDIRKRQHIVAREIILNAYRGRNDPYLYIDETLGTIRDEACFVGNSAWVFAIIDSMFAEISNLSVECRIAILFAILNLYGV